jgi:uroporphyrin-3 C-methyltransferase
MSDKPEEGDKRPEKSAAPAGPAEGQKAKAKQPVKKEATPSAPRRGSPFLVLLSLLALLLAVATLGAGAWLYRDLQALQAERGELTERLQRLDDALAERPTREAVDDLRGSVATLRNRLDEAQGQVDRNSSEIDQSLSRVSGRLDEVQAEQETLRQAVENARDVMGRDHNAWMLAEIEHLLRIANHRVRLENDFKGGIRALETADQRLRELGDPAALPVRSAIAEEIARLENVERPDLAGIALRLQSTAEQVDGLGPGQRASAARATTVESVIPEPPEEPTGLTGKAWRWLTSLVSLTRQTTGAEQSPKPGVTKARQSIEADLAFARFALLDHDASAYRRHLGSALQTLGEAFDTSEPRVARLTETLESLEGARLSVEIPDLGGSLAALRSYRAQRPAQGSPDTAASEAAGAAADPAAPTEAAKDSAETAAPADPE